MPPEEDKIQPGNITPDMKEAVVNQLDSFINPAKTNNTVIDASSYYSQNETKPKIKSNDGIFTPQGQTKVQNKPIVRTYRSDAEDKIQTGHISSINIAMAENKRMLGSPQSDDTETKKTALNKILLIISSVLVIGGILIFFVPKLLLKTSPEEKVAAVQTISSKPVITADSEEKINIKDINPIRVSNSLKEKISEFQLKIGQIKNIYLTEGIDLEEKLITSKKFLELIKSSAPADIQRTIKDSYMFGLHNYNGNQKFLVLKVGSYGTTFSGMLSWEANLWQDFKVLFDLPADDSASADSFFVEVKKFQDATFDNKDCRVVKNSSGKVVFLYSIIDENTIVITTSTDTLREIIGRISKARVITQ